MSRRDDQNNELSANARQIIDAAADNDGPTTADRDRVRSAVLAAIAAGAATTAGAGEAATTAGAGAEAGATWATVSAEGATGAGGLSMLTKVTIACALIGGAAGLYLAASSQDRAPEQKPHPSTTVPTPAPEQTPEKLERPDRETAPDLIERQPDPPEPPPAPVRKKAAPREKPAPVTSAPPVAALEQERMLLDLANDALRSGKAARTLEIVAESRQLFPSARLGPERDATEVLARCALGRTSDAAQRALERFRRKHASSPLLKRVESACGEG